VNKPRPTRKLAELTAEFMADAFRKQGFARTELVTRWKEIAGAEIAACAEPLKLQWPRGRDGEEPEPATLVLRVEGPAALEIQHQSAVIIERVNRFFGYPAVNRVVFKQGKPAAAAPKPRRPELRPVPKELGEGLREIADPELRACLESLASQIAASNGRPSFGSADDAPLPEIIRSK